mgnify:CR=1 FL=1
MNTLESRVADYTTIISIVALSALASLPVLLVIHGERWFEGARWEWHNVVSRGCVKGLMSLKWSGATQAAGRVPVPCSE